MWANAILGLLIKIVALPVAIIGLLTTLISGLIMAIPIVGLVFVLLTSLLWLLFLGPLLGSAWLWHRGPALTRPLLAVVGIPIALLGNTYIALLSGGPDPGDQFSRHVKQALCQHWPYAVEGADGRSLLAAAEAETGSGFFSTVFQLADAIARRDSPWARFAD